MVPQVFNRKTPQRLESRSFTLEHDRDSVAMIDGRTVARSLPVWLHVSPLTTFSPGRLVRIRYRSSFFDDTVRPLIRFETADKQTFIRPMKGALLGTGEWIGRVPKNTVGVSINPVQRLGPFDFEIDSVSVVPRFQFLLNAAKFATNRRKRVGAAKTPIKNYHAWYLQHARSIDLGGIDRPHFDWQCTPVLMLVLRLSTAAPDELRSTVQSLESQVYKRWMLCAIIDDANAGVVEAYRQARRNDPRLLEISGNTPLSAFNTRLNKDDCIAIMDPGGILPDNSLAIATEMLASDPDLAVVYGDEDAIARDGLLHSPALKPDWSPTLQRSVPYLGRLTWVRFGVLTQSCNNFGELVSEEEPILNNVLDPLSRRSVGHLRRILYHRRSQSKYIINKRNAKNAPRRSRDGGHDCDWPEVTIVVPTRDKAELLAECVKGLKQRTDYPNFHVVIVDNGSAEPDALALLSNLRKTPQFTVIDRPGPFNFSALSNEGARATSTPVVAFINNDISMIENNWLKPLVRWAIRPTIGVVGAKLLYPSGSIQHAGVVVGLGEIAGHYYRKERADAPGYLGRLLVPHEVSAVTAACMAIERTKFEAVGGFDAENLPIELNDIDLCLRVAEQGWANLWTPEAVLYHHEFGSRGIGSDPSKTYRGERSYFLNRWQHVLRDDPYFHPSLSLYSFYPALA